ncbi:MAG: hypothetical protein LBG04_02005 [Holosporaceae bacterium]|jgi:chemotaxis receptor (MCP) glutamine deamidase CheD|nr:hypothetical protein [Holosporaceae bacterium]
MINNNTNLSKKQASADSKPEKLAKILYGAIVRYIKAQNARIGEKNAKFTLDFSRDRRVNVHSKDVAN